MQALTIEGNQAIIPQGFTDHAVEIKNLTVSYGAKPVLWDICLQLPKSQLIAIVGPNGAGKSTLIKAMLGLQPTITGDVQFPVLSGCGQKCRIGYVPQSESVDWDFPASVLDVTVMGTYGKLGWFRRPGKREKEYAMEMLRKVGMERFAKRQISQLSGGQQQRVFLARALVQDADIYFMDEPFKGVDANSEKAIIQLLTELKNCGKTVVVVHHDLQTVPRYFDWVTLINLQLVANGPVKDVFHEHNLSRAFHANPA